MYVWATVGGTSVLIGYVYFSFLEEVPLTKRKRWIATSADWERALGDQEYQNLLKQYRKDILPTSHRAAATVTRVGSRIAKASLRFATRNNLKEVKDNYYNQPYTYTVIRSDQANAFVLPGNHVFLMTGLFRYVHSEDDLAAVLGHEMAHNLARHAGEKISGSFVVNFLARMSLLVDPSGLLFLSLIPAAQLFRELPHSRTQELEADQIGIYLSADACYDPRAAKRVFATMKAATDDEAPPEFLSTHPSHDSRLDQLDKWMPAAMQLYRGDDGSGARCRRIREEMSRARQFAAQQAAIREGRPSSPTRPS